MIHYPFNFLRPILYSFIALASICPRCCKAQLLPALPPNQLILPAGNHEISLQWYGDTVHAKWEPHVALLIPVKLPYCPKQFYMQFDLGAPYSMFYSSQLKQIQSKYPRAVQVADTTTKLLDVRFEAGNMMISAKEIMVRQMGHANKDSDGIRIIGTIGADLIAHKVAIIDYVQQRLFIGDHLPAAINSRVTLSDFIFSGRRILLPAIINGKKTILYFDTGSSAYELITDKATCGLLAVPGSSPVQYQVTSWGRALTANTFLTNDSIIIGSQQMPLHRVTYIEGVSKAQVDQMKQAGIGGMTGNKLFLNKILVLDTKQQKFGIINTPEQAQ